MIYLNHQNLNQNELRNFVVQVLASAPTSPKVGQAYYDSNSLQILTWNGTAWTNKATDSALLSGNNAAFYLNRANHTGSQTAATISNLATVVQGYSLSSFAAPTGNIGMAGYTFTGLSDPVNPQDAATKNYVDVSIQSAAAGIDSKPTVDVVATANIASLSGLPTVDGVTLTANQRVLLTAQTNGAQNGPWIVSAGAWVRPTDNGATGELNTGALWFISKGTSFARTQWILSTTGAITPGTTAVTINQYSAGALYTASNGVTLTGSNFTAAVVATGGISAAAAGLAILLPSVSGLQTTAAGLSILLPTSSGLVITAAGLAIDTTRVAGKYSQAIGDGSATSITVTHSLGTTDITSVVLRDTSGNAYMTDWQASTANAMVLSFAVAPTTNQYRVSISG